MSVPSGSPSSVTRDSAAFNAAQVVYLYERHGAQIYRFCLRQLGNREDAEDATQMVFLRVFGWWKIKGYQPAGASFLFRIAQNVCSNSRRSALRRRRIEIPGEIVETQSSYEPRDEDTIARLPEALRALPDPQRRVILYREWQGLSYQEIGERLGLSQGAVESLLFRARRALADRLTPGEAESRGPRPAA
jgi:RNA polymerase sigma-70 factor (ECF subfamily)